jgi:hypothetical protein
MERMLGVLVGVLALSSASWASAQGALPPAARLELERLQATSSPALRPVVRDGRLTWLGGLREPARGRDAEAMARDFLARHAALAGLDPEMSLVSPVARAHRRTVFVSFGVTLAGLQVLGARIVVSSRDGLVRHVASSLRPGAAVPSLGALIDSTVAARIVAEQTGRPARAPTLLAWLPLTRELVPVWVVEQREVDPPHDWRVLVEARTGAVLDRLDQLQRAEGLVYDPNPEEAGGEVSQVELPDLTGDGVLEGPWARAFQCGGTPEGDCVDWETPCRTCGLRSHLALADAEGNFLYPPDEPSLSDPFAEVQAYYHLTRFGQWLAESFEHQRLCNGGHAIDIHVNYSVAGDIASSANSYYGDADGDGCGDITMGEGLGVDFAYDADVIFHEAGHGVVEDAGGLGCGFRGACYDELGPDWTALGLNEGYADYLSVAYTDDPELGEHAGRAFGGEGSIRDADNDRLCPFDLVGESHSDGRIWAGTGWDLRMALGADVADQLVYRVLLTLADDAGYAEAAAALLFAADEALEDGELTEEERADVARIVGPEGRRIDGCERIIPLDQVPEGHAEDYMMLETRRGTDPYPAGIQWSLTAPRRATELRFWIEEWAGYRADSLAAHVRKNAPVNIEITFDPETRERTITYTEDYVVDMPDNELVLNAESDPPLEAETTYYIAIAFVCADGCLLRARGEVDRSPNTFPVAESGADQEVAIGETVELDGSASSDPDGDELVFEWEQTDGPTVALEGGDGPTPSFVAAEPGEHVFLLHVTDPDGASDSDEVVVRVASPDDAGPDAGGDAGPGDDDDDEGGCDCGVARPRPAGARVFDLLLR